MRSLVTSAALLLTASGLTLQAAPASGAEPRCTRTPVVAHRGITQRYVENTRGSVSAAIRAGVWFEVDLRATRDGKLMLMHDRTVRRTTNGRGYVSRMTGRRIRSMRTNDGQRVPYAAQILRMLPGGSGTRAMLHVKELPNRAQRVLAQRIKQYRVRRQVSAISFSSGQLAAFRARNPGVRTYRIERGRPSVAVAARNGGAQVFVRKMTPAWASRMRERGIPFNARLTGNPRAWEKATRYGVDSIVTDRVGAYRSYCS